MEHQEQKTHLKNNLHINQTETKKNNINNVCSVQNQKIDQLKLELLQNQKKINNIKLRNLANIENIKKNTQEKIKQIKEQEKILFLKKIIPVVDYLEEILDTSCKLNLQNTPVIQGIELTLKSLFNLLHKLGVQVEDQKNILFNPNIHIPVLTESSETTQPKHIISIIKKGFILGKVLLRKATVTIK